MHAALDAGDVMGDEHDGDAGTYNDDDDDDEPDEREIKSEDGDDAVDVDDACSSASFIMRLHFDSRTVCQNTATGRHIPCAITNTQSAHTPSPKHSRLDVR